MMKTLSIKELSREGVSRAVRAAEDEPLLISKNNEPAVWMIGSKALARAVAVGGDDPDLYRGAMQTLAVKLFDWGALSLGRAAEMAGLPLTDFMDLCGALHVPVFREPREDLEGNISAFDHWLHVAPRAESKPHSGA